MVRIIRDKESIENLMKVLGYFMFIAAVAKLGIPIVKEGVVWVKLLFVLFIFCLELLVALFAAFNVSPHIIKLYYPTFTTPIDENHIPGRGCMAMLRRIDVIIFILLTTVIVMSGFYIVNAAVLSI